MTNFDKELRDSSKNMKLPEQYHKRIDEVLSSIPEKELPLSPKRNFKGIFIALFCLILVGVILGTNVTEVKAGFFEGFRLKIMDIFKIGDTDNTKEPESIGIGSEKQSVESKPDLMVELKESIIDKQNIYLLIEVTAPTSVEFNEDILFKYYAFCNGTNYNTDNIIGGATSCSLLEVQMNYPNKATYIVSLMTDEEIKEDSKVTVMLNNLMDKPYSDNPIMLVEGMWSMTFDVSYTVREEILIENFENLEFSFLNTTATVEKLRITPFGMSIVVDVSKYPNDELYVTDTSINISVKMVDGKEYLIESHNIEDLTFVCSGASSYTEEGGKILKQNDYEFEEQIDINKILGIYVEDVFVPVN